MDAYWTKTGSRLHALLIELFETNLNNVDIYPTDKINIAYMRTEIPLLVCVYNKCSLAWLIHQLRGRNGAHDI